jgi:hypothetical protein
MRDSYRMKLLLQLHIYVIQVEKYLDAAKGNCRAKLGKIFLNYEIIHHSRPLPNQIRITTKRSVILSSNRQLCVCGMHTQSAKRYFKWVKPEDLNSF